MRWTVQPPSFSRSRLRRAALRYAAHGWPVTPGAVLFKGRFRCDRLSCPILGCHPAHDSRQRDASDRPDRVSAWWRARPHPVLLATGHAFDVVDVPARLGLRVLCTLRLRGGAAAPGQGQLRGPVAVTPTGRWMFLVRPGDTLRPELEDSLDVIQHGPGSWIPAPPTLLPEGPVRWAVGPQEVGWHLPHSYAVQQLVMDARELTAPTAPVPRLPRPRTAPAGPVTVPPPVTVPAPVTAHPPVAVPRQVSTMRRAG